MQNQPDQQRLSIILLLVLLLVFSYKNGLCQCSCTNCPVTLPNSGTAEGYLTISGATSNVLNTTQFVKAVNIDVLHDALRECEITLIAPNGSSVLLSDNNGVAINNNIIYDICIVNCTETAVPDPGFPINFTSNANYMSGQTYIGSYFPYNGACLSTLTGPVNGQWTLRFQDFVAGDGGTLLDWSIELANNSGTSCTFVCAVGGPTCDAEGGTLINLPPQNNFCENDPDLQFSMSPDYGGNTPDPALYSYVYVLTNISTNQTIEYNTDQDFTGLPPGNYRVCGLSYLTEDEPDLPVINGTNLTPVINNLISNNTICADFSTNCFNFIIVSDLIPPTIDGPTDVCPGQLVSYIFTNPNPNVNPVIVLVSGSFSFFNVVGNQINVAWAAGPGEICIRVTNACGTEEDCIVVNVSNFSDDFDINGQNQVCAGDIESYQLDPSLPSGYSIDWQVANGTILNETNDDVSVLWNNGASGQICAVITDPCDVETEICLNIIIIQLAPTPVINIPPIACTGSVFSASVTPSSLYIGYNWTITQGTILSGQGTPSITISSTLTGITTICVEVLSDCAPPQTDCRDIEIVEPSVPNLQIVTKCGLNAELQVINPDNNAVYTWTQLSGPGSISFGSPDESSTDISASQPGSYIIQVSETLNNCTGINTVSVTLNPDFIVSNPEFDCISTSGYIVSFTITGGLPPYFVDNIQIVGNNFTSGNIPFGTGFSFIVSDSEDCEVIISGEENCPCVSEAGDGSNQLISVCEDETAVAEEVTGVFLDGNDAGVYVLHSNPGNILGNVFATSATPEFMYLPALQYGVTYYISFVVGNETGGTVDFNDPCLSVSFGQPVIFNKIPLPFAGDDIQTCENNFELNGINDVSGSSTTWSVVFGNNVDIEFPELLNTLVTVESSGNYVIMLEENNEGCIGTDEISIQIFEPISTQVNSINCDPAGGNYTVTFTISGGNLPYFVNGLPIVGTTFTSAPFVSGDPYSFAIEDLANCMGLLQGIFNCNCVTRGGTMSSEEQIVCAEGGQVTATYNNDGIFDPNDVGMYVLHTNSNNIPGSVLAFNNTGIFNYQSNFLLDTRYYVSYVIGNENAGLVDLTDICIGVSPGQPVIFRSEPEALINPVADTCGLENVISSNPVSGNDYIWSSTNSNISFENANGFSSIVRATNPGNYEIILLVENDVCRDSSTINLVFLPPVVILTSNYNCKDIVTYEASLTLSGVGPFSSNVPSANSSGNILLFENLPSGINTTVLITASNGCTGSYNLFYNCACQSVPGTMASDVLTGCEDQMVQATYNLNGDPGNVDSFIYILHTSSTDILGTVLATSSDGKFSKTSSMGFNTTYYISYVTVNFVNGNYELQPCSFIAPGQPVIFYENPSLIWNESILLCDPQATFNIVTSSVNISLSVLQSPPNSEVSDLTPLGITVDLPGKYLIEIIVEEKGCTTMATKELELFDSPVISNITTECEGLEFTAGFNISGGSSPYYLNGNEEVTSPYTSDLYASLTDFSFYIEDARGCKTPVESVTKECNCITNAGSLGGGPFELCEGVDLNPVFQDNYTLDSDDAFMYILHDGIEDSIGTIIFETKFFPVLYDPAFAGKQYFLTRVAGNVLPGGGVDLSNPCTDKTPGILVSWSKKPDVKVIPENYYCEGNDVILMVENLVSGSLDILINQLFTVSLQPGLTSINLDINQVKNGDELDYIFTDDFGCLYNIGSDILNIRNRPDAGQNDGSFMSCLNVETTIGLSDYIQNEDAGGQWYLGNFTNKISDIITIDASLVTDTVIHYIVTNECGEDTSQVLITRNPIPDFGLESSNPLCAGISNGTIVINELSSNQEITYFLNGVKTEILTIENLESGNYNVTAINEFGCETDSGVILEEAEAISVDIGADLNITLGEEVLINLISDIPNDSIISTVWTLPDGQVINGRLFSVTIKGEFSGILSLIITDKNGCTAESSIRISIKETEIEVEIPNVILVGSSSNNLFTIAPNPGILLVKECFIYDRWGNKVYSVENSQPGSFAWDGTFAGSECQQGVYVYKVLLRLASGDEKLFAGDLTLLR